MGAQSIIFFRWKALLVANIIHLKLRKMVKPLDWTNGMNCKTHSAPYTTKYSSFFHSHVLKRINFSTFNVPHINHPELCETIFEWFFYGMQSNRLWEKKTPFSLRVKVKWMPHIFPPAHDKKTKQNNNNIHCWYFYTCLPKESCSNILLVQ